MGFEVFPWNSHFETGIELIDQQHRKLVEILNCLARDFSSADNLRFRQLLHELLDYAHYHFTAEEKIWRKHFEGQSLFQGHHQAHDLFFEQVNEYWKTGEAGEEDLLGLLDFLTRWLAFHILESDRRMALMVKAIEEGKSLDQARALADDHLCGPVAIMVRALLETYGKLSANAVALARERSARIRAEARLEALGQPAGPDDPEP